MPKKSKKTTLRFHVYIKGSCTEITAVRDEIIAALNGLELTVKRMPDDTRVHVSPKKDGK